MVLSDDQSRRGVLGGDQAEWDLRWLLEPEDLEAYGTSAAAVAAHCRYYEYMSYGKLLGEVCSEHQGSRLA